MGWGYHWGGGRGEVEEGWGLGIDGIGVGVLGLVVSEDIEKSNIKKLKWL